MKTISVSPEDMEARIARFQDLKPIPAMQNAKIPLAARDHIYARKLLPVISSKGGEGPFGPAPIAEADGYSMTLAVCPPNQRAGTARSSQDARDFYLPQRDIQNPVGR